MDVKNRLRTFIATNFNHAEASILDDTPLLESDIVDSTGVMELVFFVGDEFGVEVSAEDLTPANFNTINGLSHYISIVA